VLAQRPHAVYHFFEDIVYHEMIYVLRNKGTMISGFYDAICRQGKCRVFCLLFVWIASTLQRFGF
jgi:hypothetical protein